MESQPLLPDHAEPKFLEYTPDPDNPDSPPWSVLDWRALKEAFDLRKDEILHWHLAMAGQGRPWLVVRRIFWVAPMWGEEAGPDDARQWTWAEMAKAHGVPESRLKQDLEAAVEYWKRERNAKSLIGKTQDLKTQDPRLEQDTAAVDVALKKLADMPMFGFHQALAAEQVMDILIPLRFEHIKDTGDRLYIANRCLELRTFLEDKHRREPTRQLILLELTMAAYEQSIMSLKQRLNELRKDKLSESDGKELDRLATTLEKSEKAYASLMTRHSTMARELGADEIETGERKREALGTISYLADAHRRYYEAGDRELIDGVFTADEVVWMTTPLTIRPAQYRPDIVVRLKEALQPENLWNGAYEPTPVGREACRRLKRIVESLEEEQEPEKIEAIDSVLEKREDDDLGEVPEHSGGGPVLPAGSAAAPTSDFLPAPAEEDVMVIG